jgi:ATP-dependent Clp protease ATP-binding subunit ClpB
MIQLKIEREAVKKEKDEASHQAPGLIEDEITKLEKRVRRPGRDLEGREGAGPGFRHRCKEEIERIKLQIEDWKRKGDFNKVAELQYGKLPELEKRLKEAQAKEMGKKAGGKDGSSGPQLLRTMVGAEEIAEVVSRATGIPVSKLMQGERDKLLKMEGKLHERVVGQEEAIVAVWPTPSAAHAPG